MQLFLQFTTESLGGLMPLLMILVAMIFFVFIPNRRKEKAQATFMGELKKGDKVVTASGILGTIDRVEDKTVNLNVGNRTFMQVTKNSISKDLTDAIYPKVVDKS